MKTQLAIVVAATVVLLHVGLARAEEPTCENLTRTNVVKCAVKASLTSKSEQLGLESFEGRRRAAGILLPSNPTVSLSGGYTIDPSVPAADRQALWGATLSQELEVAGQRGARLDFVGSERRAQEARVGMADREAASNALIAYFDALAAAEDARVANRLAALAVALKNVAKAGAQVGVGSTVNAQLAEAAATRLVQAQLVAEQRVATTRAVLATLVGLDPLQAKPRVAGDLTPLAVVDATTASLVDAAVARRGEIVVAAAEKDAYERRVTLYERLRIPNPTVSVFVRNDWIGERSIGVGIGFPIPFPAPVGRTYAGEIAEATSLARRAETETERLRRAVRLEVATALEVVLSRKKQVELYRPEQVRATEDALQSIAEEIATGRLPVREAMLTQQGLSDYLMAYIEARRALCVASVDLARAAGTPLDRGAL